MDKLKILETKLKFWNQLDASQRETVLQNAQFKSYQKGETIYSADCDCVGVILILKGELRSFLLSDEGREVTLYRLRDNDICILSASCILKNISFEVHIEAQEATQALLISAAVFARLVESNIHAEVFALQMAASRFTDVVRAMEQILFFSFDTRLANFLTEESRNARNGEIAITHDEIARQIGSAREVVTRMLKYFSNEGIVEQRRGGIKILDSEKLFQISRNT